jgi:hypothetical protein
MKARSEVMFILKVGALMVLLALLLIRILGG